MYPPQGPLQDRFRDMVGPRVGNHVYVPPSEPRRPAPDPRDIDFVAGVVKDHYRNLPQDQVEKLGRRCLEHIDFLRSAFPDITAVKGLRILDIACGSRCYPDNVAGFYDPWMPRILTALGADVLGVDYSPQQEEHFKWRQVDLMNVNALSILESQSFDAYNVCAFPTRKFLAEMVRYGRTWPEIRTDILNHVHRALKPDGRYIRPFTKRTEEYVTEHTPAPPSPEPGMLPPWQRYLSDDD